MQKTAWQKDDDGRWVIRPINRRLRIVNQSTIPTEVIRDIVAFVRPPGISGFNVFVRRLRKEYWFDYSGHGSSRAVIIRFGEGAKYPRKMRQYQIGQHKGKTYWLYSQLEGLVYIMAHELMHVRQGQLKMSALRRGRIWGARGRYSEIETEAYAIRKLREWRRAQ